MAFDRKRIQESREGEESRCAPSENSIEKEFWESSFIFLIFYSFLLEKTRWTKVSERISTKNSISSVFLINDQQFRRVTQHSNEIIDQSL